MGLTNLLIFAGAALLFALLSKGRGRGWFLLVGSVLALFWLQPLAPIRWMDFWLPVLTLFLAAASWALTTPPEQRNWRANLPTAAVLVGVVLLVALTRYLGSGDWLTAARPPQTLQVLVGLALAGLIVWGLSRLGAARAGWLSAAIVLLLALLVVLKLPPLATLASAGLRGLVGQSTNLAAATDLRWLGYSYVAFRLIHTLRDRQNGRLPGVSLQEYLVYVIFAPAITAGPIDRLDRFVKDLRRAWTPSAADLLAGGQRLALGLLKKFVVADLLAMLALNATNAAQVRTAGWTWLLVYAYAFQIFFDFSGYTDIAIGLGRLVGVSLPENFNAPYLKPNLTLFWNNWHMTLTQWFRAYFFNPFTRALRTGRKALPVWEMVLLTQISTMLLIGLWHGITWNFVLWGVWHGLGLFAQNRYSDWAKPRLPDLSTQPAKRKAFEVLGVLLTFHYVALGWVWFALPSLPLSLRVFAKLFGM